VEAVESDGSPVIDQGGPVRIAFEGGWDMAHLDCAESHSVNIDSV
jgi:hypothetical protein